VGEKDIVMFTSIYRDFAVEFEKLRAVAVYGLFNKSVFRAIRHNARLVLLAVGCGYAGR